MVLAALGIDLYIQPKNFCVKNFKHPENRQWESFKYPYEKLSNRPV